MEAMLVFLQRHPAVLVWTVVLLLPLVMQSVVRARLRRFGYSTRPAHLARSR
jgi:phosphatidylglycerophosphate synthase